MAIKHIFAVTMVILDILNEAVFCQKTTLEDTSFSAGDGNNIEQKLETLERVLNIILEQNKYFRDRFNALQEQIDKLAQFVIDKNNPGDSSPQQTTPHGGKQTDTTDQNQPCPTSDKATSVQFPPQCCSFPFTRNQQLYYRCVVGVVGFPGCYIGRRIWVDCITGTDFGAQNKTIDINIPFVAHFTAISVYDWIVFQQRIDGTVSFSRPWSDYKAGFGNYSGNFWLGLEKIHRMTNSGRYMLRIEMMYRDGTWVSAEYETFSISNETRNYTLTVTDYSGDSGDVMNSHSNNIFNGMPFSTSDRVNAPNGANYASPYGGGWWFKSDCCYYFLNGLYSNYFQGGSGANLSTSRMMMKRVDA